MEINEKRGIRLRGRLLLQAFGPLIVLFFVSVLVTRLSANDLISSENERTLSAGARALAMAYSHADPGKYVMADDGKVYKGSYCISDDTSIVDEIAKAGDCVATFFWGDTRVMTSILNDKGQRIIGTKTSDSNVIDGVLKQGKTFFNTSLTINGLNYYVVYEPVFQEGSKSEIVGMTFIGVPSEDVRHSINRMINKLIIAALAVLVVFGIITLVSATKIVSATKQVSDCLDEMSEGNFAITVPEKILNRGDEIGVMGRRCSLMIDSLHSMLSNVTQKSENLMATSATLDKMADETARTITHVETAVNDIATGATAQAQDTTKASENVMEMGNLISLTIGDVSDLAKTSERMEESGKTAMNILEELKVVNERAISAIDVIYEQTNETNASAKKIREATSIISAIAGQTNLLALNASIEAARAGDAGRGFAVVADQISKLADQSNKSAKEIESITNLLIDDSDKTVETMNEVKEIMSRQTEQMTSTQEAFGLVSEGIEDTKSGVDQINSRSKKLDEARAEIVEIIQGLTAIAEENAASTEETSAASAEVTAAADNVSRAAVELKEITTALENSVSGFKF